MAQPGMASTKMNERSGDVQLVTGWAAFLAHFLFLLAAWTVVIKYLFPIGYAAVEGVPWTSYVYWDLWPVAHVWLGWALLRRPGYTRPLAIGMSIVEIIIIVSLFAWFLSNPDWSIWRTNWFINKIFVLLCFFLILGTSLFGFDRFSPRKLSASTDSQIPKETTA